MVELHNGRQFLPSPNRIQSAAMSMHWLKARAESKAVPEQQIDGFTRVDKIRPDSKAQDCLL
jgi:hypothetical protein